MKDISQLSGCFSKFVKSMTAKLVDAQSHATDTMKQEAESRIEIPLEARSIEQFVAYSNSLKEKKSGWERNEMKSSVYSDLYVYWQKKGIDVPVGAFLEWGTGPMGEDSNDFPHGYDYTTDAPWDLHSHVQMIETGTWGITARPHMYPALVSTQPIFITNVKEAVEEAWME